MIENLLEDDIWCYWLITVGALFSFVGFLLVCICGCRRHENKSEFLGLAGMVTITNHAESREFDGPSTTDIVHAVAQDTVDGGKRVSGANRSLPDIPKDKNVGREGEIEAAPRDTIYEASEMIGDPSELYATVQDKNLDKNRDFDREPTGSDDRETPSILEDSVHPYARLDALGSSNDEHPYAQVQSIQKTEYSQQNRNKVTPQFADNNQPSTSTSHTPPVANPVAPPRTRRSSSHNSLLGVSETTCDNIQAANAITGGVQANQDLPYMTPPILYPLPHPPAQSQQNVAHQHFSGDSQDSKGYTSISVREPLANIIAQTKGLHQNRQGTRSLIDPHYATVSDDSDEMYAAIDEQDKVYTSGSETYAQIQPMTMTEVNRTAAVQIEPQIPTSQVPLRSCAEDSSISSAPQPPSVDSLRYVAHAHSRQASSSSATSSIANPGSPKPEKRQANSPLPPPPPPPPAAAEVGKEDFYASVEKRGRSEDRARSSISSGKSLEDMYAKVMKKKQQQQQQHDADSTIFDVAGAPASSSSGECGSTLAEAASDRKPSLVEVSRASWSSHDSVDIQKMESVDATSHPNNINSGDLSNAEKEAIEFTKNPRTNETSVYGYEPLSNRNEPQQQSRTSEISSSVDDPNYEMLRPQYASSATRSNVSSSGRNGVDVLPVYSLPFKHRQVSNASSQDPGYERVGLRSCLDNERDTDSEPNYESMPHDTGKTNYASVCRTGDSDTDPNYESVIHGEPNYESVRYTSVSRKSDPPYERVIDNYKQQNDYSPVGYESVKCNPESTDPNYEKIHPYNREVTHSDTDDEQYVQV